MITYFGSRISPNKVETAEGFLICRNVPIARIGDQKYFARELQLDGDPNREVLVHRYEEDVFDKATIASFEGKPVTNTHPNEMVDPDNWTGLSKGHVQNVRREGDFIVADLYINDADLINDIQSRKKEEVSCGYYCSYIPDGGDYKQTKIRGNHVAVVQYGRAGHEVAIKDAAAEAAEKGRTLMSRFKDVLAAFGMAAKDAEPDEMKALTELASMAMDAQEADPAEKAPEAEPAKKVTEKEVEEEEVEDEMVEKAPKGDDLGTKLDKLIEMVGALMKTKTEDADDEESEVIEEEEEEVAEDGCGKDALEILRPAIMGISNPAERRRMTSAILKASAADSMGGIFAAAASSAKKANDASGRTSFAKACEESENAYAARNPHTMKKED